MTTRDISAQDGSYKPDSHRPILGIDSGITGGIAALCLDGRIEAYDIPTADGSVDIDALVRRIREHVPRLAIIERASAMPKQGVASTFKFGTAYGALLAVTALCEIPTHLVSPRKWKTHFALDSDKEKSRALAIRLWPGCGFFSRVKDHGRAEAALLARYGAEVVEMASIALQHGVPVETIRRALLRDPQGRASSPLGTALDAIAEAGP